MADGIPYTTMKSQGMDNGSFLSSWRPSSDPMVNMEGITRMKDTRNWRGDGLEMTDQGQQTRVDAIPAHVRGSTPDSVVSKGTLTLTRDNGVHRFDIDKNSLQAGMKGPQINGIVNLDSSTRKFVSQLENNRYDGLTGGTAVKKNIEMRSKEDLDVSASQETPQEKTYFLPKLIFFIVFIMTLIAAIVVLIVEFKENEPGHQSGSIVPDPINYAECQDISLQLGNPLEFVCTIEVEHPFRKALDDAEFVNISRHNKVSDPDMIPWSNSKQKNGSFIHYNPGKRVNCSSEGIYNLTFLDVNGRVIPLPDTISLRVTTKASQLNVTFEQRQNTGEACDTSVFVATCHLSNDCHNYEPEFFRRYGGNEDSISHYMQCSKQYTDLDGNTINCSATFPENVLDNNIFLWCRMASQLELLEEPFPLPTCKVHPSCREYTRGFPPPFNCSAKSSHIEQLNNGTCQFEVLNNCFRDRSVFKYFKDLYGDLSCTDSNNTVPVCRLSWCRDYSYIVKKEIPGATLCQSAYQERTVQLK